jgi:putative MFS transporter
MTTTLRMPIAARIERLPESKYLRVTILLISLGTFWDSYMLFSVGPISAHFFAYLGQPHFATELPLALFFGTFVGAVGLSTVADKIGRRRAFTLDLCILALGALIAAFSPNATVLLIALFIAGIGTGAELPLSTTYVQELSPARSRGKMSSFSLTIGFLGGTVGVSHRCFSCHSTICHCRDSVSPCCSRRWVDFHRCCYDWACPSRLAGWNGSGSATKRTTSWTGSNAAS